MSSKKSETGISHCPLLHSALPLTWSLTGCEPASLVTHCHKQLHYTTQNVTLLLLLAHSMISSPPINWLSFWS